MEFSDGTQFCPQLQRAAKAWVGHELSKSFEELKKAPFDASLSTPVSSKCMIMQSLLEIS
jgi:hypothetical protein